MDDYFIKPNWPVAPCVHALFTTRLGGMSGYPYGLDKSTENELTCLSQTKTGGLNLGLHVGDDSSCVAENRLRLNQAIGTDIKIIWPNQTHSTNIYDADRKMVLEDKMLLLPTSISNENKTHSQLIAADAVISRSNCVACAILTADCLPILIADRNGRMVAAIHAGWRGLANGIIEKTIAAMWLKAQQELAISKPLQLVAILGPAISTAYFEVGKEVKDIFLDQSQAVIDALNYFSYFNRSKHSAVNQYAGVVNYAKSYSSYSLNNLDLLMAQTASAFYPSNKKNHYYCNLVALAQQRLKLFNVNWIGGGMHCTYRQSSFFYSYRRDGTTGRIASLIWLRS